MKKNKKVNNMKQITKEYIIIKVKKCISRDRNYFINISKWSTNGAFFD